MVIVGTQRTVSRSANSHTVSWKVDDFLKNRTLETRLFCFKPLNEQFRLTIRRTRTRDPCNNETDGVEFAILKNEPSERSLSWKLWVKNGDGEFLEIAKGVWNTLNSCRRSLGPIREVTKLLHPDGSLMLQCKLGLMSEIDDAPSPSRQHSAFAPSVTSEQQQTVTTSSASTSRTFAPSVSREQETTPTSSTSATSPTFSPSVRREQETTPTSSASAASPTFVPSTTREQETTPTSSSSETSPRTLENDLHAEDAMELCQMAIRMADKYEEEELKLRCLECIRGSLRSVELFCPIINIALQNEERELTEQATEFFTENFEDIVLTIEWGKFVNKNPNQAYELLLKALRMKDASLKRVIRRRDATKRVRRSLFQRTPRNVTY